MTEETKVRKPHAPKPFIIQRKTAEGTWIDIQDLAPVKDTAAGKTAIESSYPGVYRVVQVCTPALEVQHETTTLVVVHELE